MGIKRTDKADYQLYPLGDAAVVLQFGDTIDQQTLQKISSLATYILKKPFTGFIELVPAYTTLTVYYNPWILSEKGQHNPYQKVVTLLQKMVIKAPAQTTGSGSRTVEIPVCYGGSFGPDLKFVAEHAQLTPEEVVTLHAKGKYTVYMIGFAPGFPYLGGMNSKISAPRKEAPRAVIPAGSVGIAGKQTGIYPMETPGGWQLIGRTPLTLFDPNRERPSLLQAGDTVKFIPITAAEFEQRKDLPL